MDMTSTKFSVAYEIAKRLENRNEQERRDFLDLFARVLSVCEGKVDTADTPTQAKAASEPNPHIDAVVEALLKDEKLREKLERQYERLFAPKS